MAISIDWGTRVITVPQADLLQVQASPIEVYQLDLNDFRNELNDLEQSVLGMPHPDTHVYVPPKTVSGVTLARIVEIINGYTITFSPDLPYGVNIVGGNSNVADVVNPNNVSVRSANSAGLQDAESLQAASFDGHVTIDVVRGVPGTTFPRGTQQTPSNNIADAHEIAEARGISRFLVIEPFTLDSGIVLQDGYVFYAERNGVVVTIDASADVTNCTFRDIAVTGTLDSNNRFHNCEVFNASSLQAVLTDCGLTGTLELVDGLTELINCHSGTADGPSTYPRIDLGDTGSHLVVRDYAGGLVIENCSDPLTEVSIDVDSGHVVIDATVTAGTFIVRGLARVDDNSTGTAVVYDRTVERRVTEQWRIHGLDPDNPMTVTPTDRTAGDITQTITGDGTTTSTVTRT